MISRTRNLKLRGEEGWVIVVAMAVMAIMLVVGLATLKIVDTQAQSSGAERVRESSFNLAEGLLYSEANVLQRNWPRKAPCSPTATGCGYDVSGANQCTQLNFAANQNLTQCPNQDELIGTGKVFSNTDDARGATWTVTVRDNSGSNPVVYDKNVVDPSSFSGTGCVTSSGAAGPCNYDKNGDKRMWVRVDATVNGKTRSLVALLQLEQFSIPFAHNAVVAGSVSISNSGNKTVVDSTGSQVVVRCTPSPSTTTANALPVTGNVTPALSVASTAGIQRNMYMVLDSGQNAETVQVSNTWITGSNPVILNGAVTKSHPTNVPFVIAPGPQPNGVTTTNQCENWGTNNNPQVSPQYNYQSNPSYPSGLSPAQLAAIQLGADAIYDGTCPSNANAGAAWVGKIYIVNTPAAGCTMNPTNTGGSTNINSFSDPGWVIVQNGTLTIAGNTNYYGVVYCANQQASSGVVLTITSTAQVIGGVAVDGNGQVVLGQNLAVTFYDNAFNSFAAAGAAGLVQNSWRELNPGQ